MIKDVSYLTLPIAVPSSLVADVLGDGYDYASGYWAKVLQGDVRDLAAPRGAVVKLLEFHEEVEYLPSCPMCGQAPRQDSGCWRCEHGEGALDGPVHYLTTGRVEAGLAAVAQRAPHLFAALLTGECSSSEADGILQYIVLGENRYG